MRQQHKTCLLWNGNTNNGNHARNWKHLIKDTNALTVILAKVLFP